MAQHHFIRNDRVLLVKLKTAGLNNRSCARILRFHPSTIGRELKRGAANTSTGYSVRIANTHAHSKRRNANQQHRKLTQMVADRIVMLISQYWSPEQIAHVVGLSHNTIYRWI